MIKRFASKLIEWLTPMAYEAITLDKVNKKLIQPLPGLPGYYKFAAPADMPQGRFIHYLHLTKRLDLNVDEQLLNTYLDGLTKAFENGDSGKFNGLVFMLRDTLANVTPVETYYWIAALLYFDKKEDLTTFDFDYNQKKVAHFKSLPNQSFFLATLIKHCQGIGEASLPDIEAFLKGSQVKAESYRRILTMAK